ncbi:MAG TPA: hypothetical protein VKE93_00915 [Candidatus Angelobacter sp.]|nr:hypothetical protein [Candidatus Angelobacter sp.]
MRAVVCAILLLCVLIIVIAPQVDLPPTALRTAQRLILPLLIQLAALVLVFTAPIQANQTTLVFTSLRETSSPPVLSPLSVICVLLC